GIRPPGESDERNQAANHQPRPKHTPADQQRYVRLLLPRRRPQCRRPAAGPRPVPRGSRPVVVIQELEDVELLLQGWWCGGRGRLGRRADAPKIANLPLPVGREPPPAPFEHHVLQPRGPPHRLPPPQRALSPSLP